MLSDQLSAEALENTLSRAQSSSEVMDRGTRSPASSIQLVLSLKDCLVHFSSQLSIIYLNQSCKIHNAHEDFDNVVLGPAVVAAVKTLC